MGKGNPGNPKKFNFFEKKFNLSGTWHFQPFFGLNFRAGLGYFYLNWVLINGTKREN